MQLVKVELPLSSRFTALAGLFSSGGEGSEACTRVSGGSSSRSGPDSEGVKGVKPPLFQ